MGDALLRIFLICALVTAFTACKKNPAPVSSNDDGSNAHVVYENTVADALAENCKDHEESGDYKWDSTSIVHIQLNGNSISAGTSGITVIGTTAAITAAGTYVLSGSLSDGQILVNTEDKGVVRLILDGVDIHNSSNPPIHTTKATKTVIVLADNTTSNVSDGTAYPSGTTDPDAPNAAIFSMSDLSISGKGSLTVEGNYRDGISSKDGLIIKNGTITVTATDDGIRGKDYLIVKGGTITVNAGGDGMISDNVEDAAKGYLYVSGGTIRVTSGGDALEAVTDALITDGNFTITSGGGCYNANKADSSEKGIKAAVNTIIDNGMYTISSADDALHSNGNLIVNGGTFIIMTGDDGMHSDSTLTINGGTIGISQSYEGIEGAIVRINDGNIHVNSSDDGINVSGGNDGSGTPAGPGAGPGGDIFASSGNYSLTIGGGSIVVMAGGDGIDSNGSITMTGGTVIVHGPTMDDNGALDYQSITLSGGFVAAAGSSGMAQAPGSAASSQNSLLVNFTSAQQAGTIIHIQSEAGDDLLTFAPAKSYQSIAFTSPGLITGTKYNVYLGGSATGSYTDGLYKNVSYTPGSLNTSFTVSSLVTLIGSSQTGPGPW